MFHHFKWSPSYRLDGRFLSFSTRALFGRFWFSIFPIFTLFQPVRATIRSMFLFSWENAPFFEFLMSVHEPRGKAFIIGKPRKLIETFFLSPFSPMHTRVWPLRDRSQYPKFGPCLLFGISHENWKRKRKRVYCAITKSYLVPYQHDSPAM